MRQGQGMRPGHVGGRSQMEHGRKPTAVTSGATGPHSQLVFYECFCSHIEHRGEGTGNVCRNWFPTIKGRGDSSL